MRRLQGSSSFSSLQPEDNTAQAVGSVENLFLASATVRMHNWNRFLKQSGPGGVLEALSPALTTKHLVQGGIHGFANDITSPV